MKEGLAGEASAKIRVGLTTKPEGCEDSDLGLDRTQSSFYVGLENEFKECM